MPFPHVREEVGEHVFGVDAVMKAMLSGLDSAGDVVERRMKDEIAESPAHEIVVGIGLSLYFSVILAQREPLSAM